MSLRRVYRVKPGSIRNLKMTWEEMPLREPGEVTIEIDSIGLNFADLYAVWGLYSATPKGSFIPGLEFCGRVSEADRGSKFQPGDEVIGVTRFGAYTDRINLPEQYLIPLPEGWTKEEGAAYPVQVLTAYYALFELADLQPGDLVLIHSGAGGVGLFANQLAKNRGAVTIGTTGSTEKIQKMREEGYDHIIVRGYNFYHDLDQCLGGRPLRVILECIGGRILRQGFRLLAPQGRMVVYGAAHFTAKGDTPNYLKILWKYLTRPRIDPMQLPTTNRSIMGFNLIYLYDQVDLMHRLLEEISRLKIDKPFVGQIFDFENLPNALRALQSGRTMGKVVVQIRP